MNVIGIGNPGCKIVEKLENYKQYKTFYVDTENQGYTGFYTVRHQNSHHDYEKNYKKLAFRSCKGEKTLILSGAGDISGIILRLLEQFKNDPLTVVYIKSDEVPLAEAKKKKDRIVMQVLQQYARSGMLKRLFVVSNKMVEEAVGDLTIKNYWEQINNVIASTFHMYNVFENTEPLLKNTCSIPETARISTFGVVNYKTGDERLFYDLKFPRSRSYYYNLNNKTLDTEKDTLNNIRQFISEKSEEKTSVGFSIYPTDYEENYVYSKHDASYIQEENEN